MPVETSRISRTEALEAFLSHHLVDAAKDLGALAARINSRLATSEVLAPAYTKEVSLELRLKDEAKGSVADAQYQKRYPGRTFIEDFKNALAAWLCAIYSRANQPEVKFEVAEFDGGWVTVQLSIDYLAPAPARRGDE